MLKNILFLVLLSVLIIFLPSNIPTVIKLSLSEKPSADLLAEIHGDPFQFPFWKSTEDELVEKVPEMSVKQLRKLIQWSNKVALTQAENEFTKRVSDLPLEKVVSYAEEINLQYIWEGVIRNRLKSEMNNLDEESLANLVNTPLSNMAKDEMRVRINNGSFDPKFFTFVKLNES